MTQQTPSSDDRDGADVLARLAAYSPTTTTLAAEWNPADRADLRARLLQDAGTPPASRFRARRTHRRNHTRRAHVMAPLAAAAAVIALIVGIVSLAVRHDDRARPGLQPGGAPYTATTIQDTAPVGPTQYAYTFSAYHHVAADGRRSGDTGTDEEWIAPSGDVWSYRVTGKEVDCYHFPFEGSASFSGPTKAFVDGLPTNAGDLETYLRNHAEGSTSQEEAMFTAVSDLLGAGDGLATSELRAAMVSVLSRTGGVTVHRDVVDDRGRPAVRADFVDDAKRPGQLSSLYFDPSTYRLLERREGSTGREPADPDGPSVAYSLPPAGTGTPVDLTGPALINVITTERVVDELPAKVRGCNAEGTS